MLVQGDKMRTAAEIQDYLLREYEYWDTLLRSYEKSLPRLRKRDRIKEVKRTIAFSQERCRFISSVLNYIDETNGR